MIQHFRVVGEQQCTKPAPSKKKTKPAPSMSHHARWMVFGSHQVMVLNATILQKGRLWRVS